MQVISALHNESVSTTFPFGAFINGIVAWLTVPLVVARGLLPTGLDPMVEAKGTGTSDGFPESELGITVVVPSCSFGELFGPSVRGLIAA